jgi:uncharacterized protein (DUF1015 family)
MPELRPFRGNRYSPVGPLKELVCPPYDIISPAEQVRLHERHRYNAVRIELPFSEGNTPEERYRKAADQFRSWLSEGVLTTDHTPSMYVYRQDYILPSGHRGRVAGVIGALDLEPFGAETGILPHERTMPGPIEDRLALLRACPVNISPIYAIYRGDGTLAPYFDSLEARPPDARFADYAGTLHRLWAIGAPAEIGVIADAIRPGPLVIADGHHRYETALAYHREQATVGEPGGHDAVMCFCVDADAEDLVVFPFHRALRSDAGPDQIKERLAKLFVGRELSRADGPSALEASSADHPLLFVFPSQDVLVEIDNARLSAALGHRAEAWRSLDVVALHEIVFPDVFDGGIRHVVFTRESDEIVRLVEHEGYSAGVLLRPPGAADVIEVARAGERMPQKASYFWPKAVTGLVFRSLR